VVDTNFAGMPGRGIMQADFIAIIPGILRKKTSLMPSQGLRNAPLRQIWVTLTCRICSPKKTSAILRTAAAT